MKCKETIAVLDDLFDQGIKEPDQETLQHLNNCENCRNYYRSILNVNDVISALQTTEPTLSNPQGLTDDIMMEVFNEQSTNHQEFKSNRNLNHIFTWSQRLIAAASVCLMLTFGYEQYIVVNKIVALENKLSNISNEMPAVSINKAQFFSMPDFYLKKLQEKPLLMYLLRQRSELLEANSADKSDYSNIQAGHLIMNLLFNKNTIDLIDSLHFESKEDADE